MPYKYQTQLRNKAQAFVNAIESELNYDASIDPDSFREYSVGVKLGDVKGQMTIYYSPKKNTYKLVNQGLDKTIALTVEKVWNNLRDTVPTTTKSPPTKPKTQYQAYVDGSHDADKNTVGYGAVILKEDKELQRFFGRVHDFIDSRQIAGELEATMQVMNWCREKNITAIDIYYDYKGIELWATSKWKANKPVSQQYQAFMQQQSTKIHWHKVESHTGVHWNEIADQLAKKGTHS